MEGKDDARHWGDSSAEKYLVKTAEVGTCCSQLTKTEEDGKWI